MAVSLPAVFERWAYEIGRSHHGHHSRTDVRSGSSDRSGGIALTMWLCLASGICVICSNRIKNITTRPAPTCHYKRTRRSPPPSRPLVRRWPSRSWVGCTINTSEREFPTGTSGSQWASRCSLRLLSIRRVFARSWRHTLRRFANPADLASPHWVLTASGIKIERKDNIRGRVAEADGRTSRRRRKALPCT